MGTTNTLDLNNRVNALEKAVSGGDSAQANKSDIATEFSATTNYTAGCFVYHGGKLYQFNADHSAGAWDPTDAVEANVTDQVVSNAAAIAGLTATDVAYDNTASGLTATDVQGAVDELRQADSIMMSDGVTSVEDAIDELKRDLITPSANYLQLGYGAIDGSNHVLVSLGNNNISDYDFLLIGTSYYNQGAATYGCTLIPVIFIREIFYLDVGVAFVSRDNTNTEVTPINATYNSTNNSITFIPIGTPAGNYYYVYGVKIRTIS